MGDFPECKAANAAAFVSCLVIADTKHDFATLASALRTSEGYGAMP